MACGGPAGFVQAIEFNSIPSIKSIVPGGYE